MNFLLGLLLVLCGTRLVLKPLGRAITAEEVEAFGVMLILCGGIVFVISTVNLLL